MHALAAPGPQQRFEQLRGRRGRLGPRGAGLGIKRPVKRIIDPTGAQGAHPLVQEPATQVVSRHDSREPVRGGNRQIARQISE